MRVLLVSDFVLPVRGGLEVYVANLAAELSARGHEVHIATLTDDPEPQAGVRLHTVRSWSSKLISHADPDRPFAVPVPDFRSRADLERIVRSTQPDVVHAHTWLGWSLRSRTDTPVVMTVHDFAPICQLRTLWRPEGRTCAGPSYLDCLRCGAASMSPLRSLGLASATVAGRHRMRPSALMVLSRCMQTTLEPYFDMPIEVIPGFVSPQPDGSGVAAQLPPGRFAMFAGNPGRHKGLDLLLDIWRNDPPAGLDLVVASTRASELPVTPGVHLLRLTPQQMPSAWSRATVALVPSRWKEAFGLSAIEALSAGTPVIASDCGALPESVESGRNGLVVAPQDKLGWIRAIASVVEDGGLHRRLADGARASAARWAPTTVVPQIEAVYQRVLQRRRAQPATV